MLNASLSKLILFDRTYFYLPKICIFMKSKIEEYRNGAIGALLDEYERAILEIVALFQDISQENFVRIMDADTKDPDCHSMQTIMSHVVSAGYSYSYYLRVRDGQNVKKKSIVIKDVANIESEISKMFEYTCETINSLSVDFTDDKQWVNFIFRTDWGVVYDLEQMFEHAIVHILRHRRQIDKFIILQKS